MNTRQLVYKFWQLPPSARREIAVSLGLLEDSDQQLVETERYRKAFMRARERGIVPELNREIMERVLDEDFFDSPEYQQGYEPEALPVTPPCKNCGTRLLRWAWWEHPMEMIEYWYCLECDRAEREPVIQVYPHRRLW